MRPKERDGSLCELLSTRAVEWLAWLECREPVRLLGAEEDVGVSLQELAQRIQAAKLLEFSELALLTGKIPQEGKDSLFSVSLLLIY